ncbi:MAG: MerC domain-containing protein [Pseudomonadales bacterium]|jgi:hypothetical protein|nr:MerC domain-containing protein [Pseudomonadales bacterium]
MVRRNLADGAAIGISLLCLVHCLALPTLIALAPWLIPGFLVDESFHLAAVLIALPVSAIALASSLRARPTVVVLAGLGLALLLTGAFVEEETLEVSITVCGALLVASAHIRNLLLQRAPA